MRFNSFAVLLLLCSCNMPLIRPAIGLPVQVTTQARGQGRAESTGHAQTEEPADPNQSGRVQQHAQVDVDVQVQAEADAELDAQAEVNPPVQEQQPPQTETELQADAALQVQGQVQAGGEAGSETEVSSGVALTGSTVVEFFGVPLDGAQDVVFVLDCSGSMSETAQGRIAQLTDGSSPSVLPSKIDVAQQELVDALERLADGTRINVVFFNNTLEAFAPDMVPIEASAREGLIGFVRQTFSSGRTALAPAMRTAFVMNARRVVLLSDGLGNIGGGSNVVLRDAREAMHGGVRIDTIGLGSDQDAHLLRTLAEESGGLYQPL